MTAAGRRPDPWRAAVGAALCALLVSGCSGGKKASPTGSATDMPDQEVTDFVLTETDQGRPQWTLYARYAAT